MHCVCIIAHQRGIAPETMSEIHDQTSFACALRALSLSGQRLIGARFVANVLDLTTEPLFAAAQRLAASPEASAEMLADAYHSVQAVYVHTHPRSDLAEPDYVKQAIHFIAEALLTCLAPTYPQLRVHHVAEKAAAYCRMARLCASIPQVQADARAPGSLVEAEAALRREIEAQYAIAEDFSDV
jgi:hypothetical protein